MHWRTSMALISPEVGAHFQQLDQQFSAWLEQIKGGDVLVLVSADHGLIDSDPQQRLQIEQHAELQRMLRLPLCGEPRAAFCYLEPGCERPFEQYLSEHFGALFDVVVSEQLLEQGVFGRGRPSKRLAGRIGDVTVLAKQGAIIKDRLLQEGEFNQVGVHGGLSAEELYVPLVRVEP